MKDNQSLWVLKGIIFLSITCFIMEKLAHYLSLIDESCVRYIILLLFVVWFVFGNYIDCNKKEKRDRCQNH